jgi:hypothetical protein
MVVCPLSPGEPTQHRQRFSIMTFGPEGLDERLLARTRTRGHVEKSAGWTHNKSYAFPRPAVIDGLSLETHTTGAEAN